MLCRVARVRLVRRMPRARCQAFPGQMLVQARSAPAERPQRIAQLRCDICSCLCVSDGACDVLRASTGVLALRELQGQSPAAGRKAQGKVLLASTKLKAKSALTSALTPLCLGARSLSEGLAGPCVVELPGGRKITVPLAHGKWRLAYDADAQAALSSAKEEDAPMPSISFCDVVK